MKIKRHLLYLFVLIIAISIFYITYVWAASEVEPNNTRQTATSIYKGEKVTGIISSSTDLDYFKFTTNSNGIYRIQALSTTALTVTLYDALGIQMYTDTANNGFRLDVPLEVDNTYYLKVSGTSGASYNFGIGETLRVNAYTQQPYSNLCWATSAAMIISYFNNDTTNRNVEIATNKFGSNFNQPAFISDVAQYINSYTGMNYSSISAGFYSFIQLKDRINYGYPLGSIIAWKTGGAHAHAINGYSVTDGTNYVTYIDPWDGQSYINSMSYYTDNSQWSWNGVAYKN